MKITFSSTSTVQPGYKVLPEKGTKDTADQVFLKLIKNAKSADSINPNKVMAKLTPAQKRGLKEKRIATIVKTYDTQIKALGVAVTAMFAEIAKVSGRKYASNKNLDAVKKNAKKPTEVASMTPAQMRGALTQANELGAKVSATKKVTNAYTALRPGGKIATSLFATATWFNNTLEKETGKFGAETSKNKAKDKAIKSGLTAINKILRSNESLATKAQRKALTNAVTQAKSKTADLSKIAEKVQSVVAKINASDKEEKASLRELKAASKFKVAPMDKPATTGPDIKEVLTSAPSILRGAGNPITDVLNDDNDISAYSEYKKGSLEVYTLSDMNGENDDPDSYLVVNHKAKTYCLVESVPAIGDKAIGIELAGTGYKKDASLKAKLPAKYKAKGAGNPKLTPKQNENIDAIVADLEVIGANKAMYKEIGMTAAGDKNKKLKAKAATLSGRERTAFINAVKKVVKKYSTGKESSPRPIPMIKQPRSQALAPLAKKLLGVASTENADGSFSANFSGIAAAARNRDIQSKLASGGFSKETSTPTKSVWVKDDISATITGNAKNFTVVLVK